MNKKVLSLTLLAASMSFGAITLTACPGPDPEVKTQFSIALKFSSGAKNLTVDTPDFIEIQATGNYYKDKDGNDVKLENPEYSYTCTGISDGSLTVTEPTEADKIGTGYYVNPVKAKQSVNAPLSIFATSEPIVIFLKFTQPAKASSPILFTDFCIFNNDFSFFSSC